MKKRNLAYFFGLALVAVSSARGSGPYVSSIDFLQAVGIGNPYNTVHLTIDIVDSPCSTTNQSDTLTIVNDVQHSSILAAVIAGKPITVYGTGTCNNANIENISDVRLSP